MGFRIGFGAPRRRQSAHSPADPPLNQRMCSAFGRGPVPRAAPNRAGRLYFSDFPCVVVVLDSAPLEDLRNPDRSPICGIVQKVNCEYQIRHRHAFGSLEPLVSFTHRRKHARVVEAVIHGVEANFYARREAVEATMERVRDECFSAQRDRCQRSSGRILLRVIAKEHDFRPIETRIAAFLLGHRRQVDHGVHLAADFPLKPHIHLRVGI